MNWGGRGGIWRVSLGNRVLLKSCTTFLLSSTKVKDTCQLSSSNYFFRWFDRLRFLDQTSEVWKPTSRFHLLHPVVPLCILKEECEQRTSQQFEDYRISYCQHLLYNVWLRSRSAWALRPDTTRRKLQLFATRQWKDGWSHEVKMLDTLEAWIFSTPVRQWEESLITACHPLPLHQQETSLTSPIKYRWRSAPSLWQVTRPCSKYVAD